MDTDSPNTVPAPAPARDTAAPAPASRRRNIVGLPVKLALLVVLSIVVFVAALAGYAEHRMRSAANEQARDAALTTARELAGGLTESDFTTKDELFVKLLDERLAEARAADASIDRIVLFAPNGDGELTARVTTPAGDVDELRSSARAALRTSEEQARVAPDSRIAAAWPITFGDGQAGGVVAVEYDTSSVVAAVDRDRQRLLLGAVFGGSLLAAIVLLLLRRELFRPLEELRRVMAQIRGGARGVRIGWTRSDELGAVANEFDAMVAELEDAQVELAKFVNTDPLTGLLTADAFTDRFAGELTRARREGYPIALLAIDIDALGELNRTHDEAAGDQVLRDVGGVISGCTRPTDACGRTGGDSFHVALVGADAAQAAVVIARIRSEVAHRVGIGPERTRVTCGFGVAEFPRHAVDQIALERMAASACGQAQRAGRDHAVAFGPAGGYVDAMTLVPDEERAGAERAGTRELASTVHALARSLDGIDPALGGGAHSQRVARYASALARELELTEGQQRELRSAAVLHDVGKVAVPPAILHVPEEELDDRQRGALRYHAWVSRTMISGAGLGSVADIVFHVPENWNGTGYPERLREEKIPVESRILRAAELLDQLTTGATGRPAMRPFDAAAELKRRAGVDLDPDIAVRLARLVREEGLVGNMPVADATGGDAAGPEAEAA
jgi:diguanylate cyclase (GGDEF)-like protein